MNKFKDILNSLLNLIYPLHCASCSKYLKTDNLYGVCDHCVKLIRRNPKPYCSSCGRNVITSGIICEECIKMNIYFDSAHSACLYEGALKELIHKYKFKNNRILAKIFIQTMVEFIKENPEIIDEIDIITFVPITRRKTSQRGFNQSQILASGVARAFDIPVMPVLKKVFETSRQNELSRDERLKNLEGVFRVKRSLAKRCEGAKILIIDDVMTTGATLNESSRAILEAGAKEARAFTLARGIVDENSR